VCIPEARAGCRGARTRQGRSGRSCASCVTSAHLRGARTSRAAGRRLGQGSGMGCPARRRPQGMGALLVPGRPVLRSGEPGQPAASSSVYSCRPTHAGGRRAGSATEGGSRVRVRRDPWGTRLRCAVDPLRLRDWHRIGVGLPRGPPVDRLHAARSRGHRAPPRRARAPGDVPDPGCRPGNPPCRQGIGSDNQGSVNPR